MNQPKRAKIAERIIQAVDVLDPQPGEHVLEIGSGHGVAADLIARRIGTGMVLGVDRSAKMTSAASRRNAAHVAAGRATFETADIEHWDPGIRRFDAAIAINVIAFSDASHAGHDVVKGALRSGGRFCIAFQPPAMANQRLIGRFAAALSAHGYGLDRQDLLEVGNGHMVIVVGWT